MYLANELVRSINEDQISLKLSQGETITLTIELKDENGEPYELGQGEIIIFGVKKDITSTTYSIKKQLTVIDEETAGNQGHRVQRPVRYILNLSDQDTNITAGRYFFDVGIKTSDNEFYRPIKGILLVEKAVSFKGDIT